MIYTIIEETVDMHLAVTWLAGNGIVQKKMKGSNLKLRLNFPAKLSKQEGLTLLVHEIE